MLGYWTCVVKPCQNLASKVGDHFVNNRKTSSQLTSGINHFQLDNVVQYHTIPYNDHTIPLHATLWNRGWRSLEIFWIGILGTGSIQTTLASVSQGTLDYMTW